MFFEPFIYFQELFELPRTRRLSQELWSLDQEAPGWESDPRPPERTALLLERLASRKRERLPEAVPGTRGPHPAFSPRSAPPPEVLGPASGTPPEAPWVDPLAMDLIRLEDWLERAQRDDRVTPERALSTSRDLVAQLMARVGLEPIQETGPFDEGCQRITQCLPTDQPALHLHIARTDAVGYRRGERVFRPQEVTVYRHGQPSSEPAPASTAPEPFRA